MELNAELHQHQRRCLSFHKPAFDSVDKTVDPSVFMNNLENATPHVSIPI